MNDKNLINFLAQKQLKDFDYEIKFNTNFKNKFNKLPNQNNPFESTDFVSTGQRDAFNPQNSLNDFKQINNYDKNANLIQNFNSINNVSLYSSFNNLLFNNHPSSTNSSIIPTTNSINSNFINHNLTNSLNNQNLQNASVTNSTNIDINKSFNLNPNSHLTLNTSLNLSSKTNFQNSFITGSASNSYSGNSFNNLNIYPQDLSSSSHLNKDFNSTNFNPFLDQVDSFNPSTNFIQSTNFNEPTNLNLIDKLNQANSFKSNNQNFLDFSKNSSLNSSLSQTKDLSSTLKNFNFLNSIKKSSNLSDNNLNTNNLFGDYNLPNNLLDNQKTEINLSNLTSQTNFDLINLGIKNQDIDNKKDKYLIFKEIQFEDHRNSVINEKKNHEEIENRPSLTNSIDSNDFGDFIQYHNKNEEVDLFFGGSNQVINKDTISNEIINYNSNKVINDNLDSFDNLNLFDLINDNNNLNAIGNEEWVGIDGQKSKRFEKLLNGVLSILHKTFNVMVVNYDNKSIIKALSTPKGNEFVLDLKEVYYVSKRIDSSLENLKSEKLTKLINEINNLWCLLDKIIQKVLVFEDFRSFMQVNEIESQTRLCKLCFSNLKIGNCKFEKFNGIDYHLSCLNFYKNCCDEPILPN